MVELVKFLISNLVDDPDQITIDESVDESGAVLITVTVAPEDMGKVIGKGGKIISAVREIVKVKAIKQGKRVRLILKDPEQTDLPSPSPTEPPPTEMS